MTTIQYPLGSGRRDVQICHGPTALNIWTPDYPNDPIADTTVVPRLPERTVYTIDRPGKEPIHFEELRFSLYMLDSINEKHGRGMYVKKAYRDRMDLEVARIIRQRDVVGWQPEETDRYAITYQVALTSGRLDEGNFEKPTTDLLGKSHYERKVWVTCAEVICNDNRFRKIDNNCYFANPKGPLWCYVALYRFHKRYDFDQKRHRWHPDYLLLLHTIEMCMAAYRAFLFEKGYLSYDYCKSSTS